MQDNSQNSEETAELQLTGEVESSTGSDVKEGVFIEVCCGAAGLTAEVAKSGLRSFGVDWVRNKSRSPKAHILNLDLTSVKGQQFLLGLVSAGRVAGIHMGPPCGTASRARDRPLTGAARTAGVRRPMPLRSQAFPLGIPGLKGVALIKVQQANKLYLFCAELARRCSEKNVPWAIENPENSYFWTIPFVQELLVLPGAYDVLWDSCMHGGKRLKKQRMRVSFREPEVLAVRCDNAHEHLPWSFSKERGFDTAVEAQYPEIFCRRLAACFVQAALQRGWKFQPTEKPDRKRQAEIAVAVQKQPKRSRVGNLVSEFREVIRVRDTAGVKEGEKTDKEMCIDGCCIPRGSKRLKLSRGVEDDLGQGTITESGQLGVSAFGIFRSPEEFVKEALSVVHPALRIPKVDKDLALTIARNLAGTPDELRDMRRSRLCWYDNLRRQLEPREADLHAAMQPEIAHVMRGKNILLMQAMMKDAGLADDEFIHYLSTGFRISGVMPKSGLFPELKKNAPLMKNELWRTAKMAQEAAKSRVRTSGDKELDESVWKATLEEVDKRWCEGPFSAEEVSSKVGRLWIPSRRFGLKQGQKVRMIDDFSEHQINATVTLSEKLELGGIDEVTMIARLMQECKTGSILEVPTYEGDIITVEAHRSWEKAFLVGRTLDLSAAYRQLAGRTSEAELSVLAVFSPVSNACEFFIMRALAFGSTASVASFNWAAIILRKLAIRIFSIVTTSYFDDFPTVEFDIVADNSLETFEGMLNLLGWDFATDEKKRRPFAVSFKALGSVLDFSEADKLSFIVANTADRVRTLCAEIDEVLLRKELSAPQAASLRGKFNYAYGNYRGRPLAPYLRVLSNRAEQHGGSTRVHSHLAEALVHLKDFLVLEKPRRISFDRDQSPAVLFTDGSFEGGRGFCGGVFFRNPTSGPEYWGMQVSEQLIKNWAGLGSIHAIAQCELLPVLIALRTWSSDIQGRYLLVFVDNNAVLDSLIKGNTGCLASLELLSLTCACMMRLGCVPWITRVPSSSNIADGPSRSDFSLVSQMPSSKEVKPCVPTEFSMDTVVRLVR